MPARSSTVRLDLNNAGFQDDLFDLEAADVKQVIAALRRLRGLDWQTLYRRPGYKWEAIRQVRTPNGSTAYSLRLSQKIRALAYRDGDFLRLISLHADHDSAYRP